LLLLLLCLLLLLIIILSALQPWVGLASSFIRDCCVGFVTTYFLWGGVVSLTPNPEPGGTGYHFLSGSIPLTCLAREVLPVPTLLPA
jgi:hypothetical protein